MFVSRNIAVVHLVWLPYGIDLFKKFITSYQEFDPGHKHQLVLVFNGTALPHQNTADDYIRYVNEKGIYDFKIIYSPSGQDIDMYHQVAKSIEADYVLHLNSFSQLHANNWLKHYVHAFDEQTGIVGATASYQSYYSSVYQKNTWRWETEKGFIHNFKKYKLFVKAFFYWRFLFKPYPNPHVRTTGFMIRRKDLVNFDPKPIGTKFKAYLFENGRNSITNYFLRRGMKALVVDKNGKTYEIKDWPQSKTFWMEEQQNLLITDNQTGIYNDANKEERRVMTALAWGTNE